MVSVGTRAKIRDIFVKTAQGELAVEQERQQLASMRDFEPYAAFQRIDRSARGYINGKDVALFLKDNECPQHSSEDCRLLIRYFDSGDGSKLSYNDFLQALLPCDDSYLRAACTQRPNYYVSRYSFLPLRVERGLANLLAREITLQKILEKLKRKLEVQYDFDMKGCFKAIDDWGYNYIDEKNLKRFL